MDSKYQVIKRLLFELSKELKAVKEQVEISAKEQQFWKRKLEIYRMEKKAMHRDLVSLHEKHQSEIEMLRKEFKLNFESFSSEAKSWGPK
ncbi:hypothetical protein V6N13_026092 [Hibiscus sabdariffa]|uniref:Uncharacterized protein n=2 Tax=Hibiscus sabdariffa TaxID=183260 RepID=A0ABR2AQ13_9ROSI